MLSMHGAQAGSRQSGEPVPRDVMVVGSGLRQGAVARTCGSDFVFERLTKMYGPVAGDSATEVCTGRGSCNGSLHRKRKLQLKSAPELQRSSVYTKRTASVLLQHCNTLQQTTEVRSRKGGQVANLP